MWGCGAKADNFNTLIVSITTHHVTRTMDEGFAFKLGTGLSLLSGLFFYFAKKEYNQGDAIKNAPEIKVIYCRIYKRVCLTLKPGVRSAESNCYK